MKEPSPLIPKLLGIGSSVMFTIYYVTKIFILKDQPSGPYPYWSAIIGAVMLSYLPIRYADQEIWPSFALGIFGFSIGLAMMLILMGVAS